MAVGEFVQNNAEVTGTFLTPLGDYRFLEGIIDGDELLLSTFDGSHAFLFTATINGDKMTNGKFYSGFSSVDTWVANKDNQATLPSAYSLNSLTDETFKNKVVIIQMFGSWCPNCMDETAYLSKFYDKYHDKGLEIVGLAYERSKDFERSKKNIERLKNRFNIKYDLLITGFTNDKAAAANSLPMLNRVIAFPTMIIIDKKGDVRKIHTGFSGPGTGKHYIEFVNEFEKLINDLLNES
jgi:thiol-disulfide isomerase/thioredoxin